MSGITPRHFAEQFKRLVKTRQLDSKPATCALTQWVDGADKHATFEKLV